MLGAVASAEFRFYTTVLVDIPKHEDGTIVEIGHDEPASWAKPVVYSLSDLANVTFDPQFMRPYFLAAIQATRLAEQERAIEDARTITRDRESVETFLSNETNEYAILRPGSVYELHVGWKRHLKPAPAPDGAEEHYESTVQSEVSETKSYWFKTEEKAPARLDPYLVCSLPAENECHVFHADPENGALRYVFASRMVQTLYEAYGNKFRVRIKAASFEPPIPKDAGSGTPPAPDHPFPITPDVIEDAGFEVLESDSQLTVCRSVSRQSS